MAHYRSYRRDARSNGAPLDETRGLEAGIPQRFAEDFDLARLTLTNLSTFLTCANPQKNKFRRQVSTCIANCPAPLISAASSVEVAQELFEKRGRIYSGRPVSRLQCLRPDL